MRRVLAVPLLVSTGVVRGLVEGWQLNAIAYWQSGLPFTVTNSTARSNTGGTDRPNQIADPMLDQPTIGQWFNREVRS